MLDWVGDAQLSSVRRSGSVVGSAAQLEVVPIVARDGVRIAADFIVPHKHVDAAALIAPAFGVRRAFYRNFATFLADHGVAVLSVDYRGMGGSRPAALHRFSASLRDWAELDLAAGLEFLHERFQHVPLVWIGHSIGGSLFGLLREPQRVHRALLVSAQMGYYGHWSGLERWGLAALYSVGVPAIVKAKGYLPLAALGCGEDIPGGVALEWARWARHPDFILSCAKPQELNAFSMFRGALRAYAFTDDHFAPRLAVQALVGAFVKAQTELRLLKAGELGVSRVGHFGAFRSLHRPGLWHEMLHWLAPQRSTPARESCSPPPMPPSLDIIH